MEKFLAVAAHDLRIPLVTTQMRFRMVNERAQQLVKELVEKGETHTAITAAQVAVAHEEAEAAASDLERLVKLLFDIARARTGQLKLVPKAADLVPIVRAAVAEQQLLAPERDITLDLPRPGARKVPVMADADRIRQVVSNYLTNAIRYAPQDQPITVTVRVERRTQGAVARVEVRDHGPGIPAADRRRIWEPFERATSAAQVHDTETGLGVGLYICQQIVEGHRGHVGVENAVDGGAVFWFTLPL
jgi:signal transduction histidine kinase